MFPDILTVATSAGSGLFAAVQAHVRLIAIQKHELAMAREKLDAQDKKDSRKMQGWFTNVLRLLFMLAGWIILASLLILPPLIGLPLIVESTIHPGFLARVFGSSDYIKYTAINGFYFSPVVSMYITYVAVFLFGSARVKR